MQKKICDSLREGHFLKTAAALAGVAIRTVLYWQARGRKEADRIARGIRRTQTK